MRLYQGDYDKEESYSNDPVGVAAQWEEQGAERIHIVDLDGAKDGKPTNRDLVAAIAAGVSCECEIGGGMREEEQIDWYIQRGLSLINLGSMAIAEPDKFCAICKRFPGKVVLAIDARDGIVATRGWLEASSLKASELLDQARDLPLAAVQYTDISKDGTLEGPNVGAIRDLAILSPFDLIAAGGIGSLDHIKMLRQLNEEIGGKIGGVITGQALYRGAFTLKEALEYS